MRFQCPFCSYTMRGITHSMLARKVRCPDCDKTSRLPQDEYADGRIIGDFILKRKLGAGSIGAVFFAHQISLDRPVALKVLSKGYSNTKGIEAFLKEARAAAKLSHPNLVQSFGVGEEEGTCFMAMNFIEGETVKDKIDREGRLKVDASLHIAQQVAEGLHYAWTEAKLIHRDVKPENIMLTKEGAVKLTDLGLAMAETEWHEDMEISGSPSYMSPEQFTGEPLDTRSDIYSLGISLYQMLSGELPFRGDTLKTVAKQHFYEASKPLNKFDPMIPLKVSQLVQKMIAKEPEKRFQTMEDLIREIWEVRQTTAPDKDLIPSVHTISIKRLDYGLQELTEERKKHVAVERNKYKERGERIKKALFIIVPILLTAIVFFMIMRAAENSANMASEETVESFAKLMENSSLSAAYLAKEWESVFNSLGVPDSDFKRELHTRMRLMKAQIENRILKERIAEMQTLSESKLEETAKRLKEQRKKNAETERLLKKREAELRNRIELFTKKEAEFKKKIKQAVVKTSTIKHKFAKNSSDLSDLNEKLWKDDLRIKADYLLVSKQKLNEAVAFLKIEEGKHPGYQQWFKKKYEEIDKLKKLYNALTLSGSMYSGARIEEGVVSKISEGKVIYQRDNGEFSSDFWYVLNPESLVRIAFKVFPNDKESDVRANVWMLLGRPVDAASVSTDEEMKAIGDAFCEYKMDAIKRMSLVDRKKSIESANTFIKSLAPSPALQEKYKAELKKFFSGE